MKHPKLPEQGKSARDENMSQPRSKALTKKPRYRKTVAIRSWDNSDSVFRHKTSRENDNMLSSFIYSSNGFVERLVEERRECNIILQGQMRVTKAIIQFEKAFGEEELDGVEG